MTRFRADIQGLRAIAVLLVVAYHLRPDFVPGGYIGVDVFFVISGFLITSHLVREAATTGRVQLGAFWAARARRILPASLVTIAVTVAITAFVAPATAIEGLRRQAIASTLYVQNWVLASDAVDYSASDNAATAFQHFWSLSIEEQFYVVWPLAVALAALFAVRRGRRAFTVSVATIFTLIVAASLAYSIWTVGQGRADAYFLTTTRVWELGLGGLLAVVGTRALPRPMRPVLTYAGLAAVFVSAFLLNGDTPFPGVVALPVVLGTAAVIWAGAGRFDESSAATLDPWNWVARQRPVQWVGDRSYSLYLWHFPVIILWPVLLSEQVDWLDRVAMFALSLVLAHVSFQLIEQPVRKARFFTQSTGRSLGFALTSMVVVGTMALAYPHVGGKQTGDWSELATYAAQQSPLGALAATGGNVPTFTGRVPAITPNPLVAREDRDTVFTEADCIAEGVDGVTPTCFAGDPEAELSVALVGDSHARVYSTALAQMAQRHGFRLTTYMHKSCPFTPIPRKREVRGNMQCTLPNRATLATLLADPPDLVITTWAFSANDSFQEEGAPGVPGARGFVDYWNQLHDARSRVLVLRDVPVMSSDAVDCVAAHYDDPDVCATPRDQALVGLDLFHEAAQGAPDIAFADFTDAFCTAESCKAVIGNVLVYTDDSHLSASFAGTMTPRLHQAIEAALGAPLEVRR